MQPRTKARRSKDDDNGPYITGNDVQVMCSVLVCSSVLSMTLVCVCMLCPLHWPLVERL